MALDPIWKQQLALVSYGNEYLSKNLSFNHWAKHTIFNQHIFAFRDLLSQQLLAQHFQVWLEGLKKQGVIRISLHNSSLLLDEQNPNPNVELLPYAHFIVSHHSKSYVAWIFGKELAEWYNDDNEFQPPSKQRSDLRIENFWRYELNTKLIKRVEVDLQQPNWDEIHTYTDNVLFDQPLVQGFVAPDVLGQSYYGYTRENLVEPLNSTGSADQLNLALLPDDYNATYAHESLIRLEALDQFITQKLKASHNEEDALNHEERVSLQRFKHKLEDLTAKFVTKVANHYKTARLIPIERNIPLDESTKSIHAENRFFNNDAPNIKPEHKPAKSNVFALIVITVVICICAYYFGL